MPSIPTVHLDTLIARHTQDMTGKVVAVTGTTSGTGYVCARELAKLGAHVLLLNRQSARADAALARLKQEAPGGRFTAIVCDLQSFDSVRAAAKQIAAAKLPDLAEKDIRLLFRLQGLSVHLFEFWLVIKRIDMTQATNQANVNRSFCPG